MATRSAKRRALLERVVSLDEALLREIFLCPDVAEPWWLSGGVREAIVQVGVAAALRCVCKRFKEVFSVSRASFERAFGQVACARLVEQPDAPRGHLGIGNPYLGDLFDGVARRVAIKSGPRRCRDDATTAAWIVRDAVMPRRCLRRCDAAATSATPRRRLRRCDAAATP